MIPRVRTMKACVEEIKKLDPDTAVTYYSFRRKVLSGEIPSCEDGQKRLVNLDTVLEYYSNTQRKE